MSTNSGCDNCCDNDARKLTLLRTQRENTLDGITDESRYRCPVCGTEWLHRRDIGLHRYSGWEAIKPTTTS
jgi:hypothetical protein